MFFVKDLDVSMDVVDVYNIRWPTIWYNNHEIVLQTLIFLLSGPLVSYITFLERVS